MRSIALIVALFISTTAVAFQPRIGLWGNEAESGSGYSIDIQNGIVAMTAYSYQPSGPSQWYLASGPLMNDGHTFVATLDKYVGGQCISCPYSPASNAGNDGAIAITFQSETLATLSLPGGRTTVIQPFDFGYGPLPAGLLGEWIFVYDIVAGGPTFAERYNFTATSSPTSTGSGYAIDTVRRAGCEVRTIGVIAGQLVCVDLDAQDQIENAYQFRYGLDETFDGFYISPASKFYPMKGFRVASSGGLTRAVAAPPPEGRVHALKAEMALADGQTAAAVSAVHPFAEQAAALRAALTKQ